MRSEGLGAPDHGSPAPLMQSPTPDRGAGPPCSTVGAGQPGDHVHALQGALQCHRAPQAPLSSLWICESPCAPVLPPSLCTWLLGLEHTTPTTYTLFPGISAAPALQVLMELSLGFPCTAPVSPVSRSGGCRWCVLAALTTGPSYSTMGTA